MGDDEQLLGEYRLRGDLKSLTKLVERNGRWLMAFLRAFASSDADAEDAFQETWRRIIRFRSAYSGGSVRSYLIRIAKSVAIDAYRRNGREDAVLDVPLDDDGMTTAADMLKSDGPAPDEAFALTSSAEEVRAAVRQLPSGQRQVLMMRIEGELSFAEIAEELGIPLGTALSWMNRATKTLKERFRRLK